ncbi:HAD-IIB family hydrolase [Wenyingzhuangia sp. IMCC45574]
MKRIVFTDLDGTFINHDNYSFEEAQEAIDTLLDNDIPLIFTTSKTKAEVEILQNEVGIIEPFIVENGAALFIPQGYQMLDFSFLEEFENYWVYQLGVSYKDILTFYDANKEQFGMLGFSDMTLDEVAEYTGLSITDAALSMDRDFTEPFILKDESKLKKLTDLALASGIKITKGGRFYHLIGSQQDKGKAVAKCVALFKDAYNEEIESIGLGDGQNDIPLLENVTIPIAIQNHYGEYISVDKKRFQKSSYKGAKGWNEMILKNA